MATISAPAFMEGYRLMGFNPNKAFDVPALNIAEKLPYPTVGIDFATGKRVDLQQPKKESKVVYDKQATPLKQIQFDYALLDELEKKRLERSMFGYQMQQAADLAALPQYSQAIFDMASKTRGLDYQLALAADIFSPTRQQARSASAGSTAADRDRAMSAQAIGAANIAAAIAPRRFGRG
jgi:hypothetical protein